MTKRKRIGEVKKSNQNHSVATEKKPVVKKQKVVITSGTSLRVTFYERGAFKGIRYSNPEVKHPHEKGIPVYHEVTEVVTMTSDAVQFFISTEGKPRNIKSFQWDKMGKEARIHANIEWTADGRKFDILYIN